MRRYIPYILFVWLPFLVACERKIAYTGEYQDAKLVIQAQVCAGEDSLTCYITRSYFFLDSKPYNPEALEGVSLQIDGTSGPYTIVRDSISGCGHHLLLSRPIQAGDTLTVTASHHQLGTACAREILMPDYTPELQSVVWEKDAQVHEKNLLRVHLQMPDYGFSDKIITMGATLYITFTTIIPRYDSEHVVERWDTLVVQRKINYIASSDKMFAYLGNTYSKIRETYIGQPTLLFMSQHAQNKDVEYTVLIGSPYDSQRPDGGFATYRIDSCTMTLATTSNSYDLYQSSMRAYKNVYEGEGKEFDLGAMVSDMIGVEEPTSIYCNVVNGYGIVMSKTKTTIRIK